MPKVYTTDGKVAFTAVDKDEPMSKEQAEARAKKANKDAEALGLQTRYEVRDA